MSDSKRDAQLRVGGLLKDKWRLESLIGSGGMGVVYAARHRNGKRVAIKMLHPDLSRDEDIRTRFQREGYVANTVEHPGVVTVHDDDVAEDGSAFLVMDLLDGETLEAKAARAGGKLSIAEVLGYVDQLLDALAAAHDRGIVHRDLKPENLFLTRDGILKILDFGIARVREVPLSTKQQTRTGMTMGTPGFMAPEQARGRWDLVDQRTDIWAVGATMFNLLTGRQVHEAATPNEAIALAMMVPARSIAVLDPRIDPPVVSLVERALELDPAKRWPEARNMQAAVRAVRAGKAEAAESLSSPASSGAHASAPVAIADTVPLAQGAGSGSLITGVVPAVAADSRSRWSRAVGIVTLMAAVASAAIVLVMSRSDHQEELPAASAAPTTEPQAGLAAAEAPPEPAAPADSAPAAVSAGPPPHASASKAPGTSVSSTAAAPRPPPTSQAKGAAPPPPADPVTAPPADPLRRRY